MSRLPTQRLLAAAATLTDVAAELGIYDKETATLLRGHAHALSCLVEKLQSGRRLDPLTPAQSRVLTYVRKYLESHGEAPTRKQIAAHFDYASHNAAQEHLRALERKGFVTLTGDGPRNIRLNKRQQTEVRP